MVTSFNPDLVNDMAQNRAVLFIGSGVSASAITRDGSSIKQWEPFLREAAESLPELPDKTTAISLIDNKDYLLACEYLRLHLDTKWESLLKSEFGKMAEPSKLHEAIIKLKQRIFITTNFDKLLETAWGKIETDERFFPTVVTGLTSPDCLKSLREPGFFIFKIHGSIDDPSSLIFSKADYIQKGFENWIYKEFMSTLLLTHTFIFIGFSMLDPIITLLIESQAHKVPNGRPHYIFLPGPIDPKLKEINKRLRRLFLLDYDPKDSHLELTESLEELSRAVSTRRNEIIADLQAKPKPTTMATPPPALSPIPTPNPRPKAKAKPKPKPKPKPKAKAKAKAKPKPKAKAKPKPKPKPK